MQQTLFGWHWGLRRRWYTDVNNNEKTRKKASYCTIRHTGSKHCKKNLMKGVIIYIDLTMHWQFSVVRAPAPPNDWHPPPHPSPPLAALQFVLDALEADRSSTTPKPWDVVASWLSWVVVALSKLSWASLCRRRRQTVFVLLSHRPCPVTSGSRGPRSLTPSRGSDVFRRGGWAHPR